MLLFLTQRTLAEKIAEKIRREGRGNIACSLLNSTAYVSDSIKLLWGRLTIFCLTNACGLSASSISVSLHFIAVRLKPVPGIHPGKFLTRKKI